MARETIPYSGPDELEVLAKIANDVIDYVDWYCEDGLYLPTEYSKDPAGWSQILRDIQAAFALLISVGSAGYTEAERTLLYTGIEKYYTNSRHLFKS